MASSRISGAKLESIWQHACEPMFWLSPDFKLLWVNRAWEELTGHPAETVTGLVCRPHGPTRAGDLAGLGGSFYPPPEALAGRPTAGPTLIVHVSGERRWRRIEFWPLRDERGGLLGLLGQVRPADAPPHAPDSEAQRLRFELLEVRNRLHARHGFDTLIGQGPAHRRLLDQVGAAAATSVPVLIVGEPGTGKRLVARTIHQLGPRRQAPLVPFDCAALPAEVLERELFGILEGSHSARLVLPDGSTLLIDDILDLPRDLQVRLAANLDAKVRLLAMTAGDPEAALRDERLRADLYHALTTLVIRVHPLRERLEELSLLAQHLLERANLRGGRQRSGFSAEAFAVLLAYDWPGNLRELARVVDEAHATGAGDAIAAEDLPAAIRGSLGAAYNPPPLPPEVLPLDELLTQVERRLIEHALQRARQNKSRAAELLGISRPRLYRRIKELNLPDEPEPADEEPAPNA
ncbi:MAG: sigma-54-dependent Fis family transcriptional regulator [Planctomycetaceae bacterium]|nr:sigma-54-dependent Fis family transcriptional regulator [Planctomycetaceae bacterium]